MAIETVLKASQQLALSDPEGAASLAQRGLESRQNIIRFEVPSSYSASWPSLRRGTQRRASGSPAQRSAGRSCGGRTAGALERCDHVRHLPRGSS